MNEDVDITSLKGSIRIGAISTALTGLLPPALRILSKNAPQMKFRVTPGGSNALYKSLMDGEIDAAILVAPSFELPNSLSLARIRKEPLVLLAHTNSSQDIWVTLQEFLTYGMTRNLGADALQKNICTCITSSLNRFST
jgi:DNA-binding transcriptional LysR family regulator